jgi:L-rhamnose isomerase/sugar isomerase
MLDQSHNVTDPIESLIESAVSVQRALAQESNDAMQANRILRAATRIDAEPIIQTARQRAGGAIETYRESGYRAAMAEKRPQDLTSQSGIV